MSSLDPECVLLSGYDTVIDTTRLDAELSTTDEAVLERAIQSVRVRSDHLLFPQPRLLQLQN